MSTKTRTIDNLGIGASNQYAIQQQELDSALISDSKFVAARTEVSVTAPYKLSEFDLRFAAAPRHVMWAAFHEPLNYSVISSLHFSYTLIPSLGGPEKLQTQLDKVTSLQSSVQGDAHVLQQYNTLVAGLQQIVRLERTFQDIKSHQFQYQKG